MFSISAAVNIYVYFSSGTVPRCPHNSGCIVWRLVVYFGLVAAPAARPLSFAILVSLPFSEFWEPQSAREEQSCEEEKEGKQEEK